jgi:epoxyqueuosine reductase
MIELTLAELREMAADIGFDAIGATSAAPFPELEAYLSAYRERGETGFESGDVNTRIHPQAWMPGAQSLISVAMAYLTPTGKAVAKRHPGGRKHGHTSVYVYGEDYHIVMKEKLLQLQTRIESAVGHAIEARVAVDTSPLVDRRVAERAGIGWIGKNCMFFTPQHGSFVFLGTLAVDTAVETATVAQPNRCQSCTRCLDACPTGALVAPGVIDARTCLSYITQMKGIIPLEFREKMGRRIWGCDTCQWACPENQDIPGSEHDAYTPDHELAFPQLLEILTWTNRSFAKRFGHTAAAWRGVRVWQRNALIALGNCKDAAAVVHIIPYLTHERPELRASAAWALSKIGGQQARCATEQALEVESDPDVRAEMLWVSGTVQS